MSKELNYLCQYCGTKLLSLPINKNKVQRLLSTWYVGKCDFCKKEKPITEARDFGYPEHGEVDNLSPEEIFEWGTPPPQQVFEDLKSESIELWRTYDDNHGYATEKIDRIKDLPNVESNFCYMFQMFDWKNQQKIIESVKLETWEEITKRFPSQEEIFQTIYEREFYDSIIQQSENNNNNI